MSSALSSLKKHRRAPLIPGDQQSGRQARTEGPYTDEATLLTDLFPQTQTGPEATDSLASLRSKVMRKRSPKEGCPPSDFELMSSMVQKLAQLEKKVKTQALDINSKVRYVTRQTGSVTDGSLSTVARTARTIAALEGRLKRLQGNDFPCTPTEEGEEEKDEGEGLAEKCRRLQNQVWEMERFLNDYGMIWVGGGEDPDSAGEAQPEDSGLGLWNPGASLVQRFSVNFDLVLQNIVDLNVLAGEGESHVTSVPGGARLTQPDPVPLWLYKNGIVMFSGPFRSYQDPRTQRCMQDLMDGYFPSELQERFPDGVVFQVHDRREEEFRVRRAVGFPGKGHTVGGSEEEPQDHQEEDRSRLLDHSRSRLTGQHPGQALSMERFLNKLPESVVRGGKVISIRSSLKGHLQGSAGGTESHSVSVVETPALQNLRERLESSEADRSEAEVTTLRVKSEDGERTFLLKMFFTDTIAHLRQHLDAHRCSRALWSCGVQSSSERVGLTILLLLPHRGSSCPPYDIISAFPQRCHSDDARTLLACGLTPNAALLLRPRPPQASSTNHT
ncbi:hypothetical protein NFI96_014818 [Prochilodus magdalenae]|nr:hypothetical protein NFI96_014818 [Prochilodus magdalenae]